MTMKTHELIAITLFSVFAVTAVLGPLVGHAGNWWPVLFGVLAPVSALAVYRIAAKRDA